MRLHLSPLLSAKPSLYALSRFYYCGKTFFLELVFPSEGVSLRPFSSWVASDLLRSSLFVLALPYVLFELLFCCRHHLPRLRKSAIAFLPKRFGRHSCGVYFAGLFMDQHSSLRTIGTA